VEDTTRGEGSRERRGREGRGRERREAWRREAGNEEEEEKIFDFCLSTEIGRSHFNFAAQNKKAF
jgi:hypothetical protein